MSNSISLLELGLLAAKCFESYDEYIKECKAFVSDYLFFEMYMKRNAKSSVLFRPKVYSKSFQSVIDNRVCDEDGLESAFCIFHIMKQIILDLQEYEAPVFKEDVRNETLRYLIKDEFVNVDLFCLDFIECSSMQPEVRAKIGAIISSEI